MPTSDRTAVRPGTIAAHLGAALDQLPSAVLTFDRRGRVLFRNGALDRALGLPADAVDRLDSTRALLGHARALDDSARVTIEAFCRAARLRADRDVAASCTVTDHRTGAPLHIELRALPDGTRLATVWANEATATCTTPATRSTGTAPSHGAVVGAARHATVGHDALHATIGAALAGSDVALLLIGLDRFRSVNDLFGRAAGDTMLRLAANRLRSVLRPSDPVLRMDGDRTAVVLVPAPDKASLDMLGERVLDRLARPFLIGGRPVTTGASVGIASACAELAGGSEELLRRSDVALRAAKAAGGGRVAVWGPELDRRLDAERALETDLRRAQVLGQFELHYQAQVELRTEALIGFEALLRWRHPERGLVSPGLFIPLAEDTGLIVPIGQWVLRTACVAAARWPDELPVSVNVSPRQFDDVAALVDGVADALAASGLPGERLEIEITETALLRRLPDVLAALHRVRDMGVRIAMDDFGTGYSSLSQLHAFPFDRLKIDRAFIAGATRTAAQDAVIRAIAALGCGLGMTTVAEGVETRDQLEWVREGGCDSVQGFLFSRPIPLTDIPRFIHTMSERLARADAVAQG